MHAPAETAALPAAPTLQGHSARQEDGLGQQVFGMFCAGCHGFDGLAAYPPAPSFAFGDRLRKDDSVLLESVRNGKGAMPAWAGKLPEDQLVSALRYMRSLPAQARDQPLSAGPGAERTFFRFVPDRETAPSGILD